MVRNCEIILVAAPSAFLKTYLAELTEPLDGKFMRKYFVRQQKLLGQLNGQVEEMKIEIGIVTIAIKVMKGL